MQEQAIPDDTEAAQLHSRLLEMVGVLALSRLMFSTFACLHLHTYDQP